MFSTPDRQQTKFLDNNTEFRRATSSQNKTFNFPKIQKIKAIIMIQIGVKNEDSSNTMDSTARSNRLLGPPSLTRSSPLFINETIANFNSEMHSLSNVRLVNETKPMSNMSLYDLLSFNSNTTSLWPLEDDDHVLSIHQNSA
jgi:hypothetical protein